jgi:hypothetical protein
MYWQVQDGFGAVNLVHFSDNPPPSSFSLHIEVTGNSYSAFVNGILITSLLDTDFTSGQVGLFSGQNPQSFDNFSVSETPLPAALPLFATGLGVVGLLGWRRKRKIVPTRAL